MLYAAPDHEEKVTCLRFTRDGTRFAYGTNQGFYVHDVDRLRVELEQEISYGVDLLDVDTSSGVVAFVGTDDDFAYPADTAFLWKKAKGGPFARVTCKHKVLSVTIDKGYFAVTTSKAVCIYSLHHLYLYREIKTMPNPLGLCALSVNDQIIAVTVGREEGHVGIIKDNENSINVPAHSSELAIIAIVPTGKFFATASKSGKIIRVFSTVDYTLLGEYRRGILSANLQSLVFDKRGKWLACSSDRGTVHIFAVGNNELTVSNSRSIFSFMGWLLGYFDSKWSFARYKVSDQATAISFITNNRLAVISKQGNCYIIEFDPVKGGDCLLVRIKYFLS